MHLGKAVPKLVPSFSTRRIRLGVSHSGVPSRWVAPAKETPAERPGKAKKQRR
ncbi:MAG: hypothetical protein IPQ07_30490 [Myxococcales bacterium]|nr:hypothetical protein [Myxococcales bacterium]